MSSDFAAKTHSCASPRVLCPKHAMVERTAVQRSSERTGICHGDAKGQIVFAKRLVARFALLERLARCRNLVTRAHG